MDDPDLARRIEGEIRWRVKTGGLNRLNESLYTTAVISINAELVIWGAAAEQAVLRTGLAIFRFCRSKRHLELIRRLIEHIRQTPGIDGITTRRGLGAYSREDKLADALYDSVRRTDGREIERIAERLGVSARTVQETRRYVFYNTEY